MATPHKPVTTEEAESVEFYEAMPMAASDSPWRAGHFVYRDDVMDAPMEESSHLRDEIKTTAIITLVLVAVTAVALGLIIWRGLGTLEAGSGQTANSPQYEL